MTATDKEKIHFEGRYLGIREREQWEFATRVNASAVAVLVPVTPDGALVLVEQYRIPVASRVIELPAGLVGDAHDPDESIMDAARRELIEETGYDCGRLEHLLTCPSSPGMCDEQISFFIAEDLTRAGPGGGDQSEDITVHEVPLAEVDEWISSMLGSGRQVDPKTYAALHWLKRKADGLDPIPG